MPEIEYSLKNPLPRPNVGPIPGSPAGDATQPTHAPASVSAGAATPDNATPGPYEASLEMAEELMARPLIGGGPAAATHTLTLLRSFALMKFTGCTLHLRTSLMYLVASASALGCLVMYDPIL